METSGALAGLLAAASRRARVNVIGESLCVGAAAAMAGFLALLVAGTQVLDWYWLAVLFGGGAIWSAARTLRRMPSLYDLAQTIDRRLSLSDTLSTAFFFREAPAGGVLAWQRGSADRVSGTVDPSLAVPYERPRQLPLVALLALASLGGLALRYGVVGSLDLRSPLVSGVSNFFGAKPTEEHKARKGGKKPGEQPIGVGVEDGTEQSKELDPAGEDVLREVNTPDVNGEAAIRDTQKAAHVEMKTKGPGDELAQEDEDGDRGGKQGEGRDEGGDPGNTPEAGKQNGQQAKRAQGNENSNLMDKMRDAMANLMSKLKIPPQAGDKGGKGQGKGESQQAKNQGGAQEGKKGGGKQDGQGSPSDSEGGEQGKPSDQAQAGQGKGTDQGGDQNAPSDAKSGMGSQDGAKDIRDAEQLAAMGKISEIFGKRAENLQGEIMLEVNSGKQQALRTAYSQRGAQHREAGGEIHRDEVPLELQHYVEKYFEEVRKTPAAKN